MLVAALYNLAQKLLYVSRHAFFCPKIYHMMNFPQADVYGQDYIPGNPGGGSYVELLFN